jgi:hypothetical protein
VSAPVRPHGPHGAWITSMCVAAALLAATARCARHEPEPTGHVQLRVAVRGAPASGARTALVHVVGETARGAPHDGWHPVDPSADGFTGGLTLPVGTYVLDAAAFDSASADPGAATPDYRLTEAAVISIAEQDHLAALVLDPALVPALATTNYAPVVTSVIAAPTTVDSSDQKAIVSLIGRASDRNADPLSYRWTASYDPALPAGAAPGTFTAELAASTGWKPPDQYDGTVTFTFTATDPLGAKGALGAGVKSRPAPAGNSVFTVAVNNFPDVSRLTIDDAQLERGARTTLAVSARDADGDPLAYAWDDGACNGAFLPGAGLVATYVAPADADGACRLTVKVTDLVKGSSPPVPRGGLTTSSVTINVGRVPPRFAPVFTAAIESPVSPVAPSSAVFFHVAAQEPSAAGPVPIAAFAWSDGSGSTSAFAELVAGDSSAVAWTAPACGAATGPTDVSITATAVGTALDASSGAPLTSTFVFPVIVSCP